MPVQAVAARTPLDRAFAAVYRRIGVYYPRWLPTALLPVAAAVAVGGVLALRTYVVMTGAQLGLLCLVAMLLFGVQSAAVVRVVNRLVEPVDRWLQGARDPSSTRAAYDAAVALPLHVVRHPVTLTLALPLQWGFAVTAVVLLDWSWTALWVLVPGALLVYLYWVVLSFLALELAARPVLVDLSVAEPGLLPEGRARLPLRWRLLLTLPAVNIITGVVAAGVGSGGSDRQDVDDLALGIAAAVAVSLSVSVVLTVLLAASVLEPLDQLQAATRRVAGGDYTGRIPVLSTDETGDLAAAFNEMVDGLQQREALRHAFGVFVDPGLIDRVLAEGTDLAGSDVDVTALFLDVRGFTEFAETAPPHEVVACLNSLYEDVVPVIVRHAGHINHFVGDGLLALFGVPAPLADHTARAVAAAVEIASREPRGLPVGIGVNSGRAVVGTIGGGGRREFTAIGDTVNTAARVEAATRHTGDTVLITHATLQRLDPATRSAWVERPTVPLKGKRGAVRLFAPATT